MRNWINFPHREGTHSRQAHADLPEQAIYERELGRSGFFGPATHMHHKHAPPTGAVGRGRCGHGCLTSMPCRRR